MMLDGERIGFAAAYLCVFPVLGGFARNLNCIVFKFGFRAQTQSTFRTLNAERFNLFIIHASEPQLVPLC